MLFTKLQRFDRTRFSPVHRVASLHDELDNLWKQAFGQVSAEPTAYGNWPALDLYENETGLVASVELPGMKKEDIAISLEDGIITVSGERKVDPQHDGATACRCERSLGRFERRFRLPYAVEAGNIKAAYTDGVLTINLPKAEEAKPKQIPVEIK